MQNYSHYKPVPEWASFRRAVSVSLALNVNEVEKGGARWRVGVALTILQQRYHACLRWIYCNGTKTRSRSSISVRPRIGSRWRSNGWRSCNSAAPAGRFRMVSLKYYVWIRYFIRMVYSYYHVANANLLLPLHERSVTSVIYLITITSSSAILKCGYRARHITNRKTVIQNNKEVYNTRVTVCLFTHILDAVYLYISASSS